MSTNFLLAQFINEFPDGQISAANLNSFIARAISSPENFHNFDPVTGQVDYGQKVTVLYSGNIGSHTSNLARDLGDRSQNQVRVIDKTNIGQFLDAISNRNALESRLDKTDPFIRNLIDRSWSDASERFVAEGKGKLVVIAGKDAGFTRVLSDVELPEALRGTNYSEINGVPIDQIKSSLDKIADANAKKAYTLALAQNSFAKALQDAGLTVSEAPLVNGRAERRSERRGGAARPRKMLGRAKRAAT